MEAGQKYSVRITTCLLHFIQLFLLKSPNSLYKHQQSIFLFYPLCYVLMTAPLCSILLPMPRHDSYVHFLLQITQHCPFQFAVGHCMNFQLKLMCQEHIKVSNRTPKRYTYLRPSAVCFLPKHLSLFMCSQQGAL